MAATAKTAVLREWHGRWTKIPGTVVNVMALTAGKARYQILLKARDAGYDAQMPEIQVRRGQWIDGFSIWQ